MKIHKPKVRKPVFELLYEIEVGGCSFCAHDFYSSNYTEHGILNLGNNFRSQVMPSLAQTATDVRATKLFVYKVHSETDCDHLAKWLRGHPGIDPAYSAEVIRDQPKSKLLEEIIPWAKRAGLVTFHQFENGKPYMLYVDRHAVNKEQYMVSMFENGNVALHPGDRIIVPRKLRVNARRQPTNLFPVT